MISLWIVAFYYNDGQGIVVPAWYVMVPPPGSAEDVQGKAVVEQAKKKYQYDNRTDPQEYGCCAWTLTPDYFNCLLSEEIIMLHVNEQLARKSVERESAA